MRYISAFPKGTTENHARSRGAMHTTGAVETRRVSSDVEYELTEVTPRYSTDTTMRMACRGTEKEKEKELLTWVFCFFFFFPLH